MSSDYIHSQNLCYNCFQEKPDADGPCPYCGFDLRRMRRNSLWPCGPGQC